MLRLHLPELIAAGFAVPGEVASHRVVGNLDDDREVRFRLDVDMREDRGRALIVPDGGASYAVEVVSDPQRFGGRRWWLVCPVTGRRATTLYWPPTADRFATREAHGLGYRTQRLDGLARAVERASKVRAGLGGDRSPGAPFPARPKRMRRLTYQRLRDRAGAG